MHCSLEKNCNRHYQSFVQETVTETKYVLSLQRGLGYRGEKDLSSHLKEVLQVQWGGRSCGAHGAGQKPRVLWDKRQTSAGSHVAFRVSGVSGAKAQTDTAALTFSSLLYEHYSCIMLTESKKCNKIFFTYVNAELASDSIICPSKLLL